ncbi:MAG: hypothetical protein ACXWC2_11300, partial [Ramlibacter sp.]
ASQVKEALATVLNEVQAVNSVFSSASLPVSVNAQGTYLNQIFLGMFRPDSSAAPRWMGNLKQYKLVTQGGNLVMGDANGNSAINNNTGFLSPTALSFWTYKDVSAYPDKDLVTADSYGTIGGFFRADKTDKLQGKGTPPTTYDAPDGEVVEKGGVAQQIRKENLTATFAGDRSASNPRRLYTYCPSGSSTCVADLTDPMHSFVTTNTGIGATSFGSSTSVPISSIVRTGTTALVTTRGNHGFSTGAVVTVINATQPEYNVTQAITVNSPTTFTITGLPDSPTTPATGTYTISLPGSTPIAVQTLTRTVNSAGTSGREVATATTAAAHGYSVGSKVMVSGVAGAGAGFYMTAATVTGVPSTTSFTYEMDVDPHAGLALNTYQVNLNRAANPSYSSVTLTNGTTAGLASGTIIGNNFHVGQKIIVSGAPNNQNGFNATFTVKSVSGANFVLDNGANGFKTNNGTTSATVTLTPDYTAYSVTLTRGTGSASAGATVTGAATSAPSNFFGPGKKVDIQKVSGSASNETAYSSNPTPVISCSSPCTTFTFSVPVIPVEAATGSMTVALQGPTATVSPPNLTRGGTDGTTGSVTGLTAGTFTNGQVVNIAASGTQLSSEQAYAGQWTITCPTTSCTSFTFGPINVSPASPATGSNMQAYSGSSGPDRTSLIRWIRGENNQADENNPYPTVTPAITVRESVHGDVLHSRPLVINYGDARGIVAYYGANDGIFRAVNGNITGSIGSSPAVPPGGEIWGLLLPEHYLYYDRLRQNTPELKFPSTFSTTARYKDYFIDGPTGSYQKLNADGTINTAHIFLTMRRGGRFMYALDVTQPAQPKFLWKKSNTDPGFEELGQTWSRPRLTLLQGYANPVLIFGAGYDPAEDSEPPGTDTMGRGIYVVDAATGDLLWSAVNTCSGNTVSTTSGIAPVCVSTASKGMVYAIPSDIAFVDRSGPDGKPDGKIDKLYVGDVGGNVWRVDVADSDMTKWAVTKLAALGCDSGVCAAGTAPRKFFFPPSVLSIKGAGATGSYDAISIVSGDREHPLKNTAANSAYNTVDRFFMLKDTATTLGTAPTASANGVPFLMSSLFKITTAAPTYDNSGNGFYYTFATGEKAVNAPLAVSGFIFFSTNKPKEPDGTCVPDLGTATAYAINPVSGAAVNNVLEGGGLPPSAVSGIVEYTTTTTSGGTTTSTTTQEKFCIGCGISGSQLGGTNTTQCSSALENCNVGKSVAKNLRRTYWYKK